VETLQTRGETPLEYRALGSGPPVLFLNGLAARWTVWGEQMRHLQDGYRTLAWDYRGHFANGAAVDGFADIDAHVSDALAILDAEGATRVSLVGWSLGAQIALHLFGRAPDRVASLVLLNGGPRPPWGASPDAGPLRRQLPRVARWLSAAPGTLRRGLDRAASSPEAFTWARRLGLAGAGVSHERFTDMARDLAGVNLAALGELLREMERRDASSVLGRIDVPTLVIAGDRDPFASRAAMERVVAAVPSAEYLVLPGATHFAPIECAEHLALRIEKFLGEHGYGGLRASHAGA
jgi:pimeloyl-ACP methyl ester carboxylesterase